MYYVCALIALTLAVLAPTQVNAKDPITPDCDWKASADLQPCIQAAIQKASVDNGTVLIPNGTWPLGRALVLPSAVTLTGVSNETTLIPKGDNISKPVLLKEYGVNHIVITNVTFDGGGKDFQNSNPLVEIAKADHVTISSITVQHSHGIGLLIQGGVTNAIVKNSSFIDLGNHWKTTHQRADRIQGVVFCCGDNLQNEAVDNTFRDIGLDALQFSNQSDFKILRNTFELENHQRETVPSGDYAAAIFLTYSSGGLIQDNKIVGAQGNGIDAPALQSTAIETNRISNCGAAGIGIFVGYDKKSQSKNVQIRGNVVIDNVQWGKPSVFKGGITIAGGSPEGILIEHNTVGDDQVNKTQNYGVMIPGDTHVQSLKISNNNLDGNAIAPVYAKDSK